MPELSGLSRIFDVLASKLESQPIALIVAVVLLLVVAVRAPAIVRVTLHHKREFFRIRQDQARKNELHRVAIEDRLRKIERSQRPKR